MNTAPLYHLNDFDFAALSKQSKDTREQMRLLMLAHLKEGKTQVAIADMLKVDKQQVKLTLRRFKESGITDLKRRKSPLAGAQPKIPKSEYAAIKKRILEAQSAREGGRLTGYDVKDMLNEHWKISCSLSSVYNLLSDLNLSWVSSRSRHPKQDPVQQEDFKKTSV